MGFHFLLSNLILRNYAAWTEIYQRWEMYTPLVLSYEEINPSDPVILEILNYNILRTN